jgi:ABC-type polysaccharide/polyol phosphate export permease
MYLLAAVLWLAGAAFSAVRLVAVIADPNRELSPVVSVLIVVLFAAAGILWLIRFRRTRR